MLSPSHMQNPTQDRLSRSRLLNKHLCPDMEITKVHLQPHSLCLLRRNFKSTCFTLQRKTTWYHGNSSNSHRCALCTGQELTASCPGESVLL
jgi:hypothetical protein